MIKNDMDILKEYLDIWAKYWIARAQSYRIYRDICGSSVLDFGMEPYGHTIVNCINDFSDTLNIRIHKDWSGYPWNTSAYIEFPLYARQLFPIICDQNGLARNLTPKEKQIIKQGNQYRSVYLNEHIRKYGLEQRLNFIAQNQK